ncbi:MAG TPA: hypothetical protein VNO50_13040 [Pyrinomonadaceae bacterium]|nr:hypothetical protein [Pyrinomonadaceae bacterium]
MRHLRFMIIALAAVCVLALGVSALVIQSPELPPADDDIIIKGGSLEINCGKNHGEDCMGGNDNRYKPRHKKSGKIVRIVVKKSNGEVLGTFTKRKDFGDGKPSVVITYREPKSEDN